MQKNHQKNNWKIYSPITFLCTTFKMTKIIFYRIKSLSKYILKVNLIIINRDDELEIIVNVGVTTPIKLTYRKAIDLNNP